MIELRGDIHEGGGQILRTALALSARTGQAFRIERIRAGRSRPGLQAQHLAAVQLAAQICGARVTGDRLHSMELSFQPGPLRAGNFRVDIGTAGSVTLLLQAVFWALAAAPGVSEVELSGGTDVSWSPPLDFLEQVTLPMLRPLAELETLERRRGFFPKGQGRWRFRITPNPQAPEAPLDLASPCAWSAPGGRAVAARELASRRVAERLAECASALLEAAVDFEYVPTSSQGAALTLWADSPRLRTGVGVLAERGKSSEQIAEQAVARLRRILAAPDPVEEYLADQLIPMLALRGGRMRCQEVSPHSLANLEIVSAFLGPRLARYGSLITSEPYEVVVLVGMQGSGKTTYAEQTLSLHQLISKDRLRNNPNRQRRQLQLMEEALQAGRAVVIDNTNPGPAERAPLIEMARRFQAPVRAVYFDTSEAVCRERNQARTGRACVPEVGLRETLRRLTPPTLEEGFLEVSRR